MGNITAKLVKDLRDKTGAGMMDCKKALNETEGNLDKAIEWLRKKGINTAQKKSARSASDGLITVKIADNKGIILEVNAETDFVARNDDFINFVKELSELNNESNSKSVSFSVGDSDDEFLFISRKEHGGVEKIHGFQTKKYTTIFETIKNRIKIDEWAVKELSLLRIADTLKIGRAHV